MGSEECFHLLLQPPSNEVALRAEVDAAWCVLRDLKEPVLDAENGILQAEIEGGALLHGHPPDQFALGHHDGQPQSQPRLAHLWGACQDVQALRKQGVHHKIGRTQGLAHQGRSIHRAKRQDIFVHESFLLCSEYEKGAHRSERLSRKEFFLSLDYWGYFDKMRIS